MSGTLVSGLNAHWKLDEAGGSTAFNDVSAVHAGLLEGATFAPSDGRLGGALSPMGTGDGADTDAFVDAGDTLDPGWRSQTASIWFKRPEGGALQNDQFSSPRATATPPARAGR